MTIQKTTMERPRCRITRGCQQSSPVTRGNYVRRKAYQRMQWPIRVIAWDRGTPGGDARELAYDEPRTDL
jgi:hypothetical protein